MPDSHHHKYVSRLLLGFITITLGIFVFAFGILKRPMNMDWYVWAFVASFLVCAGLFFAFNAFVHKVKSDLRRKQRSREYHKTEADEI